MKSMLRTLAVSFIVTLSGTGRMIAGEPDWPSMPYTAHNAYQAVESSGVGVFPLDNPVRMRGIILNRGPEMLDIGPDLPSFFGGQWQIIVQADDEGDFGGTALYMAQRYGDLPFIPDDVVYTTQEWLDELSRLESDPDSGRPLRPGDRVEIRARGPGLFFGGKTNINEQHSNNPAADFDILLLDADCGLPEPQLIILSDIKDGSNQFIFDASRATGAEHYQGSLVRINGVSMVDTSPWAPNATLVIQDGTGRTLPLKLGYGDGFALHSAPAGTIDIIAVFDQEAPGAGPFTTGYRLWLMNYDGNGQVLPRIPTIPGDLNRDGAVDSADIRPFIVAMLHRDDFETLFPDGDALAGNLDGVCGIDIGDMMPLIDLLLQ